MDQGIAFRKALASDLDAIEAIYDAIHAQEEAGLASIGWIRGVYPTRATAEAALAAEELYVETLDGAVVASAKINERQEDSYAGGAWEHPTDRAVVLHTLTVSPAVAHRGLGTRFVAFYEQTARDLGCPYLRIDTNERNARARALYAKLGYREVGIVPTNFNGIPNIRLVLLEKYLG